MVEAEICQAPEQRDGWHARWLAMQAAYVEYRRSSEVLEYTRRSADDPLTEDPVQLAMLEGRQRLAFERYMDARIAFLESRFDEMNRPDAVDNGALGIPSRNQPPYSGFRAWLSTISSGPALQTLAVMLLCTMALCLMREQDRVRKLETGRDELRAALVRTVHEVQLLNQKLDAATAKPAPPSQRIQEKPAAPMKPFSPPKHTARKGLAAAGSAPNRMPQTPGAGRAPASGPTKRPPSGRSVYSFSLSPSHGFKRVGPLKVLVKSIDAQKNTASLSIVNESVQLDVQHLKLNQPVWLSSTSHDRPLGLVADRITGDHLDGHLVQGESTNQDLRAIQFRTQVDTPQRF